MDVSDFNINFATNLSIKSGISKKTMVENQSIDVKVYYQSLSKKEKGKLLRYLSQRFDYPASTISGKLRQASVGRLRRDEEENIARTIKSSVWKQ